MPTYTRHPVTIDDDTADEIRRVTTELKQLQPTLDALGERLYRVIKSWDTQTEGIDLFDDEFRWLMNEAGMQGAYDAAMTLVAPLVFATECSPGDQCRPSWYRVTEAERKERGER
jgi:hypothetical protein